MNNNLQTNQGSATHLCLSPNIELAIWTPEEVAAVRLGERRIFGRVLLLRWKQRWYKRHQIQSTRLRQMTSEEVAFLVLIEIKRGYRGVIWIAAVKNDPEAIFSEKEQQDALSDLLYAPLPQLSGSSSKRANAQT